MSNYTVPSYSAMPRPGQGRWPTEEEAKAILLQQRIFGRYSQDIQKMRQVLIFLGISVIAAGFMLFASFNMDKVRDIYDENFRKTKEQEEEEKKKKARLEEIRKSWAGWVWYYDTGLAIAQVLILVTLLLVVAVAIHSRSLPMTGIAALALTGLVLTSVYLFFVLNEVPVASPYSIHPNFWFVLSIAATILLLLGTGMANLEAIHLLYIVLALVSTWILIDFFWATTESGMDTMKRAVIVGVLGVVLALIPNRYMFYVVGSCISGAILVKFYERKTQSDGTQSASQWNLPVGQFEIGAAVTVCLLYLLDNYGFQRLAPDQQIRFILTSVAGFIAMVVLFFKTRLANTEAYDPTKPETGTSTGFPIGGIQVVEYGSSPNTAENPFS